MNGDGLAEIAVNDAWSKGDAPGYIHVYSLGNDSTFTESEAILSINGSDAQTVLRWPATVRDGQLESSTNLIEWESVDDMGLANFYEIPDSEDLKQLHYRLRYKSGE
ncbi:MAG: hypothetical protein ACI9R3_005378 [Verrucomicrobiales bacterium]|jgi:hypothetical protein